MPCLALPVNESGAKMHDLWGQEIPDPQPQKRTPSTSKQQVHADVVVTPTDCLIFGHTFTLSGMNGEKVCTVCDQKAYCPGCTPNPPKDAKPFFCTAHTPQSGRLQV